MNFLRKAAMVIVSLAVIHGAGAQETKDDPLSNAYTVTINGKAIPAYSYMDFHYASFVQKGKATAEIEYPEGIRDVKVSPLSRNIAVARDGSQKIRFVLPAAGYTVVTINGKSRLFLFGEEELKTPASNVIRITDYVDNKGTTVATAAIQKALDEAARTGKQLVFPAGLYRAGSLFIPGNTTVFLEAGAVLKGSDDITHYTLNKEIGARIFITVKDVKNVTIYGHGTIDGAGKAIRDKSGDKGRIRLFTTHGAENVKISGITLRDPAAWNTHIFKSDHVTISGVKLLNNTTITNTDGFDPDASSHVTIENSFGYCGDDNVAVKLTPRTDTTLTTAHITVRKCVFLSLKSSLKVGTETRGASISDVLFEDNDVICADRALAIYSMDGAAISDIRYINNRIEENYPDLKRMGIQFRISKRETDSRVGVIQKVLVKDCSFAVPFPNASEVSGLDKEHKTTVVFDNLVIAGKKCTNVQEAQIKNAVFSDIQFR